MKWFPLFLAAVALLQPSVSAQCAVAGPSGCAVVGPGHPVIGSIASTLVWPPGAAPLCFSFGVPPGSVGIVFISPGPCGAPVAVGVPPACAPGLLYPAPVAVFTIAAGAPASLCLLIPPGLRGTGFPFCIQGVSFNPAVGCGRLTDGYLLVL